MNVVGMPTDGNFNPPTGLRQRRVGAGGTAPTAAEAGVNSINNNNNINDEGRRVGVQAPLAPQARPPPPTRALMPFPPPAGPAAPPNPGMGPAEQQQQSQSPPWRTSHVYCFVSAILAILAVITSSATPTASLASRTYSTSGGGGGNSKDVSHQDLMDPTSNNNNHPSAASDSADLMTTNPVPSSYMIDALETDWWRYAVDLFFTNPGGHIPNWMIETTGSSSSSNGNKGSRSLASKEQQQQSLDHQHQQSQQQQQPWWKLSWLGHSQKQSSSSSEGGGASGGAAAATTSTSSKQQQHHSHHHHHHHHHQAAASSSSSSSSHHHHHHHHIGNTTTSWWQRWLDPSLLQAKPSTVTDLIDKVSTSTPRLLAIANLLLALTYQMHTAVADWFLGVGVYPPPGEWAMTGRERLGSFLVFKLLLISAVAEPDTLDLLILLSWYTLLSFLRSLAHLAAATTSHTTQSGQPPRTGVLQLLLVVLLCDFVAAAVCVALFQLAGVGKVVLLTCDCALLAVEVLGHILKHGRQVLEDMHEITIAEMEEQQLRIHTRQRRLEEQQQRRRQQQQQQQHRQQQGGADEEAQSPTDSAVVGMRSGTSNDAPTANNTADTTVNQANNDPIQDGWDELDDLSLDGNADDDDDDGITIHRNNQRLLMEDSRRLDQAMDALEVAHTRRLAILDTTIFVLQLLVHAITVGHFLHIWYLHGIQFTLIDGVLALHLHSALSAASKQIAGRRNLHRIARNLDGMFPNASELDLKKAHAAGDVCCICLGAMSVGSVKKVGCGHLYHTNCLREVIERAVSIEAAKCPLCRANIVDGTHPGTNSTSNGQDQGNGGPARDNDGNGNNGGNGVGNNQDNGQRMARPNDGMNHRGERALFRFSTEGILPTWMPLPAFSFEVVRRPTRQEAAPANNPNNNAAQGGRATQRNNANANNNAGRNQNNNSTQQSFLRRLLLLAGAVPMSPEEEARALAQLVDMFPQYDRADLLRELRDRGSAESVVESVLLGVFSGRVRGSAGGEATPATANNPGAAGAEQLGETQGVGLLNAIPENAAHQPQMEGNVAADAPRAPEVASTR